jgi:hypothetical protein
MPCPYPGCLPPPPCTCPAIVPQHRVPEVPWPLASPARPPPSQDEYIQLCRATGATPAITVALQYGTPQEVQQAANWVQYCAWPGQGEESVCVCVCLCVHACLSEGHGISDDVRAEVQSARTGPGMCVWRGPCHPAARLTCFFFGSCLQATVVWIHHGGRCAQREGFRSPTTSPFGVRARWPLCPPRRCPTTTILHMHGPCLPLSLPPTHTACPTPPASHVDQTWAMK